MAFAWTFLLPVGILIARYTKPVSGPAAATAAAAPKPPPSAPFWFSWHWRLQVRAAAAAATAVASCAPHPFSLLPSPQLGGSVIALAGAALGVAMTPLAAQLRTSHDIIGVTVSAGVLVQVVWAWCVRRWEGRGDPTRRHAPRPSAGSGGQPKRRRATPPRPCAASGSSLTAASATPCPF